MAAQFVRELPAVHVAELLGGEWAARQVPDENDRAAILLTAVKSRGGPGGGTTRLALAALRTLRAAAPPGVEVFPLTVAFAANVKRKVDAAAKLRARGSQGGQTVAVRFQGGLVALQKLGLPVPADSVIVRGSVPLFVPTERAQAATLPLLWACRLQTAAAAELPAHDSPMWLAAWLRRYYARACYAAWVLGLRYKAMQRFTPLLDEVQPLNVLKGRVSMQKDGSPCLHRVLRRGRPTGRGGVVGRVRGGTPPGGFHVPRLQGAAREGRPPCRRDGAGGPVRPRRQGAGLLAAGPRRLRCRLAGERLPLALATRLAGR
jgi:hypothetical protein